MKQRNLLKNKASMSKNPKAKKKLQIVEQQLQVPGKVKKYQRIS